MKSTEKRSASSYVAPDPTARPGRTVLLDANVLFLPFVSGTDLQSEITRLVGATSLAVPSSVLDELRRLVARQVHRADAALELAAHFPSLVTTGSGDEAIVRLARQGGYIVATADADLRRKLSVLGIDVLTPRDRTRLTLVRGKRKKGKGARPGRGNS